MHQSILKNAKINTQTQSNSLTNFHQHPQLQKKKDVLAITIWTKRLAELSDPFYPLGRITFALKNFKTIKSILKLGILIFLYHVQNNVPDIYPSDFSYLKNQKLWQFGINASSELLEKKMIYPHKYVKKQKRLSNALTLIVLIELN